MQFNARAVANENNNRRIKCRASEAVSLFWTIHLILQYLYSRRIELQWKLLGTSC